MSSKIKQGIQNHKDWVKKHPKQHKQQRDAFINRIINNAKKIKIKSNIKFNISRVIY